MFILPDVLYTGGEISIERKTPNCLGTVEGNNSRGIWIN